MRLFTRREENVVVDALSKKHEEEGSLLSLSFIVADWLQFVCQEWLQDPKLSNLILKLQHDRQAATGFSWHNEDFYYKGRLYLSKQWALKSKVLFEFHSSPIVGHSGFIKTYERVKRSFF